MSILCFFVFESEEDSASLAYAAELAAQQKCSLRVVCALPDLTNSFGIVAPEFGVAVSAVVPPQFVDDKKAMIRKTEAAAQDVIKRSLLPSGQSSFELRYGFLPHIAAEETLLADMTVFPAAASTSGHPLSAGFMHILMECRLPVILAGSGTPNDGPIIIAWDGSEPAARSVRLHLPLLQSVKDVIIAHNAGQVEHRLKSERRSPASLVSWLGDRGITGRIVDIGDNVGAELLERASAMEASTILAGAYGHSRLGEHLFGGVTKTLLEASRAPALALCH